MNSNKSEKFDYLFKCKRSKFWSQVSRFRKKKPLNSSQDVTYFGHICSQFQYFAEKKPKHTKHSGDLNGAPLNIVRI